MKAWLITWEWDGEHAKVDNRIAAILESRTSAIRVRELVDFIYVNEFGSLAERLACAKSKKNNPYPAEFVLMEGIHWEGEIQNGGNPFLRARLVEDLHIEDDGSPEGNLVWRERSQEEIDSLLAKIRKAKGQTSIRST